MSARPIRERSLARLLVFLPARRTLAGKAQLSTGTVVSYVALGVDAVSGETPIALLPKASTIDLVFDPGDVFVTAIEPPKLTEGKLRLALPNLLEDRLLAEATDCHFAFNIPRGGTGTTTIAAQPRMPVAVVDRGLLTRALDVCVEAGYRVRAAYSEIYTVPAPAAGVLSVRVDRGRGVARSATHDGFSFEFSDASEVPPALALAVRQLGVRRIQAYGREAHRLSGLAGSLGVEVVVMDTEADAASADAAVNLLQGSFAQGGMLGSLMPSTGLGALRKGALKVPLAWLGVAALVAIVGMNAYYWKLEAESSALRAQMESAFRSSFPEVTAVVDPVLQTQRQLNDLRARAGIPSVNDFSVLNARAALLLSAAPLGAVTGMEYRDNGLRIKFKPGVADNAGLQNTLRAAAVQQGLSIRFDGDGSARLTAASN